ncbi:probable chitinase 10, partial [Trichonephila clavata]
PDETDIGSPADGPGEQGEATREKGYLAYYEICQLIQEQDWELEAPYPDMMGPFAYKDNQWVGFDDEEIIIEKVKFIVKEGLGGGMVWTLDNDDFRGKCYGEQSPLINTLKTALEQGSALLTQTTTTTAAPKRTTERPSRRTKATSKPTKSTTPPVFTTPEPPQPFECEDEGFFNNPTDCKKYFWCLDSGPSNLGLVAHSFTCPSGLYFNKNRDSCDYAANVVCRVKKVTTTTTTAKPRPRPRTRKTTTKATTTTTTTTTTTPKPSKKKDAESLDELKGPLNTINMNGQNLMELLQLLQQLGVNQIQDKLQGKESVEATSTINPTLPAYRSPNRRRTKAPETTTAKADLFNQYAKPDRSSKDSDKDDESKITVRPRGPQYHDSKAKAEDAELDEDEEDDELEPTSPSDDKSRDGFEFPFVYHTPSRHRSKPTTEVEDVLEDYDDEPTTTTSTAKPTPANRRVVIKVRPIPGENNKRRNNARNPANADKENRRNNYVLAQTIGVRRVARPNVLEEQTTKDAEPQTTSKPVVRRPRPVTSRAPERPPITTTQRYRSPPSPKELIVLPTGRPAVPATTRRYRTYSAEPREPALALLPDGRITCLRRGVYPHPKDCAKFLVCVPAEQSEDEYDGFIHDCPKNTFFVDKKGRCAPGDRSACSPQEK